MEFKKESAKVAGKCGNCLSGIAPGDDIADSVCGRFLFHWGCRIEKINASPGILEWVKKMQGK